MRISPRFPRLPVLRPSGRGIYSRNSFLKLYIPTEKPITISTWKNFLFTSTVVQKDSKSYLSTYEFRFHIITRFLTSTGFALGFRFTSFLVTNHSVSFQPRKRAREGRKFSLFVRIHESVEGESGQGWPLSRAPPALVRCHWTHATRSLACQAIITVLATARVRAVSLSRRKATDQVNIANRCIVASVNSISRPTGFTPLSPSLIRVSRLQQIHVFLFSSFFYFAREERSLRFEIVLNRS